jgi:hypothetical protein
MPAMGWIGPKGHLGRWAKSLCRALLAGHLIAILKGENNMTHSAMATVLVRCGGSLAGGTILVTRSSTWITNRKRTMWGTRFGVSRRGSLPKGAGGCEWSAAVNWHEDCSMRGSNKGGLEEEVLEAMALGSGVAVATLWGG